MVSDFKTLVILKVTKTEVNNQEKNKTTPWEYQELNNRTKTKYVWKTRKVSISCTLIKDIFVFCSF